MDDTCDDQWGEPCADDWQEHAIRVLEEAQRIAGQIAPDAQKDWLARAIAATVLATLQHELDAARLSAERSRVTKMVAKGKKAYAQLIEVISNPYVMLQISRDWPDDVPWSGYHRLKKALLDYGPALDRTFARSYDRIGGKGGPWRVGLSVHNQSAEWCCAAYAVILWQAARSEPVRSGSQRVHRICAALWRAVGGSNDPDWRHHIDAVFASLDNGQANDRDPVRWWFENAQRSFNEIAASYRQSMT